MKILKCSLSIIIAFLIVFSIVSCFALDILNTKILNKNYILQKIDETEFYLQISREVESGFENYIYQSGLPEDTIKDLFTEEMIKNDVNSLINYLYDGTEIVLSEETVRANLSSKIQQYLVSQNMNLNEQGKSNIEKFENLIINEYVNNVNASNTLYEKGREAISRLQAVNDKIGNKPIIILVVLVIILIIINIKDLLMVINYLGISLLTVGILFKIEANIIFTNIQLDNLLLITKSLSNLCISIAKENLYKISDYGLIFIISGVVAIVVSIILKNIDFKKEKERKPMRRFSNTKR